ncbi:helix-turn-helix domain-containing protein [Marinicella rhabdoformis]|uniref:helix-turn-helix transcriptional regulator n=1 Tax=Marinicella rhabdoformis TaxID=2580566 RepID=UPI0012AECCFC
MNPKVKSIYRPKTVCGILDCSSSTLSRMVKSGLLKPPIKLGARSVGFLKSEIDAFLNKRLQERDGE